MTNWKQVCAELRKELGCNRLVANAAGTNIWMIESLSKGRCVDPKHAVGQRILDLHDLCVVQKRESRNLDAQVQERLAQRAERRA